MVPRNPAGLVFLASPSAGVADIHGPVRTERGSERRAKPNPFSFPGVDEHIVAPEVSRVELLDGREVIDMGSLPDHADAQALAGFLLAAHVRREYVVATELLTRSAVDSDFATDVCIRRRGIDPETGARYLEELSFEIVNEQSLSDVTSKAKNLARRGVRRIFAIFVKTGEIREWSKVNGELVRLDENALFDDVTLVRPMAIKALVDSTLAEAENEVAKALIAKKNPELLKLQYDAEQNGHRKGLDEGHKKGLDEGHRKGLDEGHKKGLDEGLALGRNMLRRLVAKRFGNVPATFGNRIERATAEELEHWTERVFAADSIEQLFA